MGSAFDAVGSFLDSTVGAVANTAGGAVANVGDAGMNSGAIPAAAFMAATGIPTDMGAASSFGAADATSAWGTAADTANSWGAGTAATSGGGSFLDTAGNWLSNPSNLKTAGQLLGGAANVGQGIYNAFQQPSPAQARTQTDPWGGIGGREQSARQLQALMADPRQISAQPGYQAGLQGVERGLGARGQLSSGAEQEALFGYGQNFFNNYVNTLSGLAGISQNPASGVQAATQAQQQQGQNMSSIFGGAQQIGSGLGSIFGAGSTSTGTGSSWSAGADTSAYTSPWGAENASSMTNYWLG